MSSRSATVTAASQTSVWPRLIEVLIGVIAGGVPELMYFLWWTFQADNSASIDELSFTLSAIAALLIGGAAGFICRICWPRVGPASLYRLLNTLVWACAGSSAGYIFGLWIIGVDTSAGRVLVPFCQGATMLVAMAYARRGGLARDYSAPHLPKSI